jgi:hypothetical protein
MSVSSSGAITTTGSNTFVGTNTFTGSVLMSGSLDVNSGSFYVGSNNQIGVNTNSPQSQFVVAAKTGNSASVEINLNNNGYGRIFAYNRSTSTAANLILNDPGGNVGIGTATPSASLDVTGTGRFTSLLTINGLSQITASGGTITTPGDGFKYHTFTSSANFVVTSGLNAVEVAVLAGGGAGGGDYSGATFYSGGGGSGGLVYNPSYIVTSGSYTVTIGAGGTPNSASNGWGGNGFNSVFGTITALGGGGGARGNADASSTYVGLNGGSGGGGGSSNSTAGSSIIAIAGGITYGNSGANGNGIGGGGGGLGTTPSTNGFGGLGRYILNLASKIGGGGGAGTFTNGGNNGNDGGGRGGYWNGSDSGNSSGTAGTANTGGGGGGIGYNLGAGGTGGSGIVIVRYKV